MSVFHRQFGGGVGLLGKQGWANEDANADTVGLAPELAAAPSSGVVIPPCLLFNRRVVMSTRGVALTVEFMAWDTAGNAPKTGDAANITLRWVKDGTSSALTTTTVTEIDATNCPGLYKADLSATETDCKMGMLHGKSSTASIYIVPVEVGFVYLPNIAAGSNTGLPIVGTQVPNATAGASGGLLISGSNAGTTTLGALTITGAMSINGTGNVAQTGDSYARLGAPAGASVSADVAANYARLGAPAGASVSADIASVQADTNDIQTRIPAALVGGRIDASVGAMATDVITNAAVATSAVAEIQSGLSTLDAAGVRAAVGLAAANLDTQIGTLSTLDAAGVRSALGVATANLDTQLATIAGYIDTEVGLIYSRIGAPAGASIAADIAAVKSDTGTSLPASVAALPTAAQNADALLGRNVAGGSSTGRLVKEALYALRNKWTVSAGTYTVYGTDDTTAAWTSTVTGTAGADPITAADPA